MPGKPLKIAARLLERKKFKEVIRILEPQVFLFRNSYRYYYYLGIACLYSDDIEGANSYLTRANQIKQNEINCLLGLAAVHLMKNETEVSLELWLQVLEQDKSNPFARHGLNMLKKDMKPEEITEYQSRLRKIFPPIQKKRFILPVIVVTTLVAVAAVFIPRAIIQQRPERQESAGIELSKIQDSLIVSGEGKRYNLSEKEVKANFSKAKTLFNQYRDNLALVYINRILGSNASEEVKNLASLLKSYTVTPNFATIKDSFSYETVIEDPYLYQDCHVIWNGKVANLIIDADRITFDFLAGYHDEKELLGVVPVLFDFAINVKNGDDLELLAKIDDQNGLIRLLGVSIHIIQ